MTHDVRKDPEFTWGDRVRRARLHAGMTRQQDLADRVGVSKGLVGLWEKDMSVPRRGVRRRFYIFALSEACNVAQSWFQDAFIDEGSEP